MKLLPLLTALLLADASAGEWMFRLKDAHVQLRQALDQKDAEATWEAVDRSTRQQAGLLAAQIRNEFDSLPVDKKDALRAALGESDDAGLRALRGKELLVSKFFLDAYPHLLVGDAADTKLKDHGTRMAGPTGIVVHKKTPDEVIVPYRFTCEGHFGGQAMDYRAQLEVPSLETILGPAPAPVSLSDEEIARQAVAVFQRAREAYTAGELDTFWELLDCDSQSQASHFADQARERGGKEQHAATLLKKLSLSKEELEQLDGRKVWALEWTREELVYLAGATDPKFVSAEGYDKSLVPVPAGYKRRDRASPEPMIEFRSGGRSWQIPARVNYRNGVPEIKIFLRPPFYLRLRK